MYMHVSTAHFLFLEPLGYIVDTVYTPMAEETKIESCARIMILDVDPSLSVPGPDILHSNNYPHSQFIFGSDFLIFPTDLLLSYRIYLSYTKSIRNLIWMGGGGGGGWCSTEPEIEWIGPAVVEVPESTIRVDDVPTNVCTEGQRLFHTPTP